MNTLKERGVCALIGAVVEDAGNPFASRTARQSDRSCGFGPAAAAAAV